MKKKEEKEIASTLYNYLFHYNHHRDLWFAIPREQYVDYWNGTCADCLAHSDFNELKLIIFEKEVADDIFSNESKTDI